MKGLWANMMFLFLEELGSWSLHPQMLWVIWVYIMKYRSNGSVDRYRSRLVAKGYTQTYYVDYLATSSVARLNSIWILFSVTVNMK